MDIVDFQSLLQTIGKNSSHRIRSVLVVCAFPVSIDLEHLLQKAVIRIVVFLQKHQFADVDDIAVEAAPQGIVSIAAPINIMIRIQGDAPFGEEVSIDGELSSSVELIVFQWLVHPRHAPSPPDHLVEVGPCGLGLHAECDDDFARADEVFLHDPQSKPRPQYDLRPVPPDLVLRAWQTWAVHAHTFIGKSFGCVGQVLKCPFLVRRGVPQPHPYRLGQHEDGFHERNLPCFFGDCDLVVTLFDGFASFQYQDSVLVLVFS